MKRILGAALAVSLTTAPALPASIIKTPGPNGSHQEIARLFRRTALAYASVMP